MCARSKRDSESVEISPISLDGLEPVRYVSISFAIPHISGGVTCKHHPPLEARGLHALSSQHLDCKSKDRDAFRKSCGDTRPKTFEHEVANGLFWVCPRCCRQCLPGDLELTGRPGELGGHERCRQRLQQALARELRVKRSECPSCCQKDHWDLTRNSERPKRPVQAQCLSPEKRVLEMGDRLVEQGPGLPWCTGGQCCLGCTEAAPRLIFRIGCQVRRQHQEFGDRRGTTGPALPFCRPLKLCGDTLIGQIRRQARVPCLAFWIRSGVGRLRQCSVHLPALRTGRTPVHG